MPYIDEKNIPTKFKKNYIIIGRLWVIPTINLFKIQFLIFLLIFLCIKNVLKKIFNSLSIYIKMKFYIIIRNRHKNQYKNTNKKINKIKWYKCLKLLNLNKNINGKNNYSNIFIEKDINKKRLEEMQKKCK